MSVHRSPHPTAGPAAAAPTPPGPATPPRRSPASSAAPCPRRCLRRSDCYAGAKWITATLPGSSAGGQSREAVSTRLPTGWPPPPLRARPRTAGEAGHGAEPCPRPCAVTCPSEPLLLPLFSLAGWQLAPLPLLLSQTAPAGPCAVGRGASRGPAQGSAGLAAGRILQREAPRLWLCFPCRAGALRPICAAGLPFEEGRWRKLAAEQVLPAAPPGARRCCPRPPLPHRQPRAAAAGRVRETAGLVPGCAREMGFVRLVCRRVRVPHRLAYPCVCTRCLRVCLYVGTPLWNTP